MNKASIGVASLFAAGFLGVAVGCGATYVGTAHASDRSPESITVFVDATFGFRKDHMARQLSSSHADYEARGYHFADMEPYTENGDLVGFFVTYTRG